MSPTLAQLERAGIEPDRFLLALRYRQRGVPLEHVARELDLTGPALAFVDEHDPVDIYDPRYELPIIDDGFIDGLYP